MGSERNRHAADDVHVRIGSSLGDGRYEDGDFNGTSVVEAARLCAAPGPSAARRLGALVSGEPGIAKTRLAVEFARLAHAEGATILFGRCDDELGVLHQPFVEAYAFVVEQYDPEALQVAAIIGHTFDFGVFALLVDQSGDELFAALVEAVDARHH